MSEVDFSKYPSVSFRPGEVLDQALSERTDEGNKNQVAKRDLGRYYALLKAALPAFTEDEGLLIVSALNGVLCSPGTLYGNIAAAIAEELHDQFDLDYEGFLVRLRSLSMLEAQAVIDAVERFWTGKLYKSSAESKAALYRVGLVK